MWRSQGVSASASLMGRLMIVAFGVIGSQIRVPEGASVAKSHSNAAGSEWFEGDGPNLVWIAGFRRRSATLTKVRILRRGCAR